MRFADNVIALIIIIIVLLIIVPLNEFVMDILLTLNLALSLVILLISLFAKNALEFSIFPSLLLITTLYRLALNVSSTRLILIDGSAGRVIETFGRFVVKGNVGVGFIIFLIIIIVQFVVITKGAERVSEVAARFTLDAMPGKQMAIDADLNSGLIDEREARARRKDIQREADFYGAMDGASKFVKGDAIVGIIITVINIVGGIIVGFGNMDIQEVISTYVLLDCWRWVGKPDTCIAHFNSHGYYSNQGCLRVQPGTGFTQSNYQPTNCTYHLRNSVMFNEFFSWISYMVTFTIRRNTDIFRVIFC